MSTYGDDPSQPNQPLDPASVPAPSGLGPSPDEDPLTPGTILPTAAPAPRRRGLVIAASVGAVVLVGGGAAAWAAASYLSGDGAQPAAMVPSSAIAYANLDLDPSAGQKLAAYQFLRKLPSSDRTSSEGDFVGQALRSAIKSDSTTTIDYDRDIKPWLGKRVGVAAVPTAAGQEPQALVVVQVTDEDQARTSLRKILDEGPSTGDAPSGLVVRDGYALIGADQAKTQAMSDAAAQSDLAGSAEYTEDMKRAGDSGVASAWVDLDAAKSTVDAASRATFGVGGLGDATSGGRVVAVLRFDGGTVELTAKQFGGVKSAPTTGANGGAILAKLPADTTAAVGIGHASDAIGKAYAQVATEAGSSGTDLAELGSQFGITLPADLQTLVGDGLAVSVGDLQEPQVAVRVVTKDPAGSQAVLEKVRTAIAGQGAGLVGVPPIESALTDDGVVFALTPTYAQLVAAAGTLGQQPDFLAAVPDATSSQNAAYVNVDRLLTQVDDADLTKSLQALRAVGLTTSSDGSETELTVRVVTK